MRSLVAVSLFALLLASKVSAQDAPSFNDGPAFHSDTTAQAPAPIQRQAPAPSTDTPHTVFPAAPPYDPSIFGRLIPPAQLAPLLQADNTTVSDVFHDREAHHLIMSAVPGVMFHYGRDVSLPDTVTMELDKSPAIAHVHDNRYVLLTGNDRAHEWMRHDARTLIWIDTKEGIVIGAFFFRPNNGEPGPTVTVFTRQIKQDDIHFSELPPAFLADLNQWQQQSGIPPVLITYFIGDISKKFLLEHNTDLCSTESLTGGYGSDCEQMNADAADSDLTASLYLDQVNYATNATAWMINNPDQVSWVSYRDNTCMAGANPLACRIRLTRARIAVVRRPMMRARR